MCVARLFLSLLLCLVAGESGTWNLKIPTCPLAVGDITCLLSSCAPVRLFLLLERKVPRCTVSVSNSLLSSHAFFSSSSSTYSYYYYYYYCYSDSSSLLLSACLLLSSLFFFSTRLTVLALLILWCGFLDCGLDLMLFLNKAFVRKMSCALVSVWHEK